MATTNGTDPSTLQPQSLPPSAPGKPYIISTQDGEILYIPLSKSATRLLVTGKETDDAFALVGSGGSHGDPIGFHYHNDAHDVFLCLQGRVNIWADDQCRTLGEGDFASVPPVRPAHRPPCSSPISHLTNHSPAQGTIHAYQLLGPHTEMLGLIVPGGWEEFFRCLGEPYAGPAWPVHDDRDFFAAVLPKLKAAAERFDMVPCPQRRHFAPQPWDGSECELPSTQRAYFLRNGAGPAWVVGGMVVRPLVTTEESSGRFAIGSLEGSVLHQRHSVFGEGSRRLRFKDVHHAFSLVSGRVALEIDGHPSTTLHAGELAYVPKGTAFSFKILSRVAKMYIFCNGGGMVELLRALGEQYCETVVPEKAGTIDGSRLDSSQAQFGGLEIC